MNRVCVAVWVMLVVLETACPVGGDAGILRQALLRDEMNRIIRDSCRPADVAAVCGPDDYEDCMAECREEMKRRSLK